MAIVSPKKITENIFLRMHPIHRILVGIVLSLIAYLVIRKTAIKPLVAIMLLWDIFSLSLVVTSWIVILTRPIQRIRDFARREDGSLIYVFTLILISSFASMFTVLLLIISKEQSVFTEVEYLFITVSGMLLSWVLVHTTFAFHYAHIFYDDDDENPGNQANGLEFPGKGKPGYLDFAYFSFVIGMTFQVSDVQISSAKIRRLALVHGLLSFGLNTFVVALTINIIAGLKH